MSKSEAVVIESIEVRELLRFLFYLYILNKLSLLQRKHSKYMYVRCVNFPCFITYLAACIHAFCMFYLYVSLGQSQNTQSPKIPKAKIPKVPTYPRPKYPKSKIPKTKIPNVPQYPRPKYPKLEQRYQLNN